MSLSETGWAWPWWTVMVLVNIANVAVCAVCYRQSANAPDGHTAYMRRMRLMGLVFVLVAFYRAIFVSRYLYQYAWFDTMANSSLLIRAFACAAELSFSGLIAMAMLRFNTDMPDGNGKPDRPLSVYVSRTPYFLIACIFMAQFFATGGLITKVRLLFAIEETLWGLAFLSIFPLAVLQFRRAFLGGGAGTAGGLSMLKTFSAVNLAWCVIYCIYSMAYHLPTEYWASALQQLETGVPEIRTGTEAVVDALTVVRVTHDYSDWGFGFLLWHSAYFSVCVWLAIFLMRGPRKLAGEGRRGVASLGATHERTWHRTKRPTFQGEDKGGVVG